MFGSASASPSSSGGDIKRRDEVLPDTQTTGVAAFALTGSVVVLACPRRRWHTLPFSGVGTPDFAVGAGP
jgi:hypothetical protein